LARFIDTLLVLFVVGFVVCAILFAFHPAYATAVVAVFCLVALPPWVRLRKLRARSQAREASRMRGR
jgi:ABC-type iron transport system FetAB permease component